LNSTKDKFFSIIAHDLKNPFAALLNISEVFANYYDKMKPTEIEHNIKTLYNSTHHTHKLLENLLE
jgi:K+-sensing histidine kinase KdpD